MKGIEKYNKGFNDGFDAAETLSVQAREQMRNGLCSCGGDVSLFIGKNNKKGIHVIGKCYTCGKVSFTSVYFKNFISIPDDFLKEQGIKP